MTMLPLLRKFKRTSKSQQVFQVCSASQGMSGFGGRSCYEQNGSILIQEKQICQNPH